MKRLHWVALVTLVAVLGLAVAAVRPGRRQEGVRTGQLEQAEAIGERVGSQKYILPEGWKEAVKGVTKIKVSNFGALEHDPATVQNAKAFEQLTGIKVELLAWAEPPIVARPCPSLRQERVGGRPLLRPPDHLHADGGGRLAPPDRRDLERPGRVEALRTPDKERPDRTRRAYLRVHRAGQDHDALLPASVVPKPPATWTELQETAKKVTTIRCGAMSFLPARDGHRLPAPRHDLLARWPDGGPEEAGNRYQHTRGKERWKMLTDMVLTDKSAPSSWSSIRG